MFYKLLNSYVRRFGFPKRGLKYFLKGMKSFGIANKTYQKKLPGGIMINVNPTEHIQQQLFWYGYYEKPLGDLLKKWLNSGSVFLDIGANIGYFSLLAARYSPNGRIISLEPVSTQYKALLENIKLNELNNIKAFNLAAGNIEETRIIYLSAEDNTGMSSLQQPENYSGKKETVKVITLDNLINTMALPKLDLVKIDVEGNELAVLKGMKEITVKFQPDILLELNPHTLSRFSLSPADVLKYAAELCYDSYKITKDARLVKLENEPITDTADVLLIHTSKKLTL